MRPAAASNLINMEENGRMERKENKKNEKYKDLCRKHRKAVRRFDVQWCLQWLENLGLFLRGLLLHQLLETIQKTTIMEAARILRKVSEMESASSIPNKNNNSCNWLQYDCENW